MRQTWGGEMKGLGGTGFGRDRVWEGIVEGIYWESCKMFVRYSRRKSVGFSLVFCRFFLKGFPVFFLGGLKRSFIK